MCTNPIWVVNTRLTVDGKGSFYDGVKAVVRDEGVGGLWKGLVPALFLVVNPIIQYTSFEQMKAFMEKRRDLTALDFFFMGALGKLLATGLTYPYM